MRATLRRLFWAVLILFALAACDKGETEASRQVSSDRTDSSQGESPTVNKSPPFTADDIRRPIAAITLPLPPLGANAKTATVGPEGGSVVQGPVSLVLDPGDVNEDVVLAISPALIDPDLLGDYSERMHLIGDAFSVLIRGGARLRNARIEVTIPPEQLPTGCTPYLLHQTNAARAYETADARSAPYQRREAASEASWTLQCLHRTSASDSDAGEQLSSTWSSSAVIYEAPGDADYRAQLQVVVARGIADSVLHDSRGKPWMCIHVIDPPAGGSEDYLRRLKVAFEGARDAGLELDLPQPTHPVTVTIRRDLGPGLAGFAIGPLIALRNDLTSQPPDTEVSRLEATIAHEWMHVLMAHAMTFATWIDPANDSLVEGGADWFAWHVYREQLPRSWVAPTARLEDLRYDAAPFWIYLHERDTDYEWGQYSIMHDVLATIAESANDVHEGEGTSSLPIAYGLGTNQVYFTDVLDSVLNRGEKDQSALSKAYAEFARAILYSGDFATETSGDPERPGLWQYGDPSLFPPQKPWSVVNVAGTTPDLPFELGQALRELSSNAIRIVNPIDQGTLHIRIPAIRLPDFADASIPTLHVTVYGEEFDGDRVLLVDKYLTADAATKWETTIGGFGFGGQYKAAVMVFANTGWRRRELLDGKIAATGIQEMLEYEFTAHVEDRTAMRPLLETYVQPAAGAEVWTVSKTRNRDDNGKQCFGSVMQAVNDKEVKDGDVIQIDPGTYEESVALIKAVVIHALVPGTVTIRSNATTVSFAADGASVFNLTIEGPSLPVRMFRVTNCALEGCIVISGGEAIFVGGGGSGNVIRHNWISCMGSGVRVGDCPGAVVADNIIAVPIEDPNVEAATRTDAGLLVPRLRTITGTGIDCFGSPGSTISGNQILAHIAEGVKNLESGIVVGRSDGTVVAANHSACEVVVWASANVSMKSNRVSAGVRLRECQTLELIDNEFAGGWRACEILDCDSVTLRSNVFYGGIEGAVIIRNTEGLNSIGDSFQGAGLWRGLPIYDRDLGGPAGLVVSKCTNLSFTDALISGMDQGASISDSSNVLLGDSALSQWSATASPNCTTAALSIQNSSMQCKNLELFGNHRALVLEGECNAEIENVRIGGEAVFGIAVIDGDAHLKDIEIDSAVAVPLDARTGRLTVESLRLRRAGAPVRVAIRHVRLQSAALGIQSPFLFPTPSNGFVFRQRGWEVIVLQEPTERALMQLTFDFHGIEPRPPMTAAQPPEVVWTSALAEQMITDSAFEFPLLHVTCETLEPVAFSVVMPEIALTSGR